MIKVGHFASYFLLATIVSTTYAAPSSQNCMAIAKRVDKGFRQFFLMDTEVELPVTRKTLASHCRKGTRALKGLKNYREQCTVALAKQIINIGIVGVTKSFQALCSPANYSQTVEMNKCIPKKSIRKYQECFKHGERLIGYIGKNSNSSNVLPMSCCGFNYLDNCILDTIMDACPDRKINAGDFYIGMYHLALDEVRDFSCGKLNTIDECRKRYSVYTNEMDRIWNNSKKGVSGRSKTEGIIYAFINISESLSV